MFGKRDSSQTLTNLFCECCILDAWRTLHPSTLGFTWDKPDGSLSSQIDLVGCPYSWASSVSSCEIYPCPFLDHSALVFTSLIPEVVPHGPGRWHLNVSILDDPDYVTLITDFSAQWQKCKLSFPSSLDWWDLGKSKIKGLSINHCNEKCRERHGSRSLLSNLASHFKSCIDTGVVSCMEVYQNVLAQISSLDSLAAKGSQICSRARWAEEGETSSSFFFHLEKKRGSESWISAIHNREEVIVSKLMRSALFGDIFI